MRVVALALCLMAQWAAATFDTHPIALTSTAGLVTLDYFAWDAERHRLWIPGGNMGSVFVLDGASGAITEITGFPTAEFALGGRHGRLGAASVAIGKGFVYIGNRADSSLCVVDAGTLARGACRRIAPASQGWAGAPDGVVYVAATRELWVTRGAPPLGIASVDHAISVFDVSNPREIVPKGRVPLGASAEGYAVDPVRGRFYTNLEESGETIAVDVRHRRVVARWKPGCDEARGLALDAARGMLFVACSARIVALDVERGKVLATLATGDGLDNIDYDPAANLLYAAAANAGELTVARVDDDGRLVAVGLVPTARGARGVVAAPRGAAYVADPYGGRIIEILSR